MVLKKMTRNVSENAMLGVSPDLRSEDRRPNVGEQMKQDKIPFLNLLKGGLDSGRRTAGELFNSMQVSSSVIVGHIDTLSVLMLTVFFILFAFGSIVWKPLFPDAFSELMSAIISMMLVGILAHEVFWGSDKSSLRMIGVESTPPTMIKRNIRVSPFWKFIMFGVCVSSVALSQVFMKILFAYIANVKTTTMFALSTYNFSEASFYGAVGIMEECFFAWFLFNVWLMFMRRGKLALPIALVVNATIFASFHVVMYVVFHIGDQAFLAAMFCSRLSLDMFGYYMTDGTLAVPMSAHFFGNVSVSSFVLH